MSSYIVVFMTVSDEKEATKIVRSLLKERLIACVNPHFCERNVDMSLNENRGEK